MKSILNNSKALIVDVRSNRGGTRDLVYELAKYFIHPDSIYVVNAVRQRAPIPLSKEYKNKLHNRFLFSFFRIKQQRAKKRITVFENF